MLNSNTTIALALSGGGIRAMVFHLGALKYYAEQGLLENIKELSTVSGGSLIVGLIYKNNNYEWPSSKQFLDTIYENIRSTLCHCDIQRIALKSLFKPSNWRFIFSRANVLASVIENSWGINVKLSDIKKHPIWSINGTTAETGRRFRFKQDTFGDYKIGYALSSTFSLSQALAVSAAFPGGIGPLAIESKRYSFLKRVQWDAPQESAVKTDLPFDVLHVYDGGIYDNLGTEPLFDSGKGETKRKADSIIVSDAGSPLQDGFLLKAINPFRLKRVLDICMEQTRALRVRSFMNYLLQDKNNGRYLLIGQKPSEILDENEMAYFKWQSSKIIRQVASYPTNLKIIKADDFDAIARHGYEMARAVETVKTT
ncbi:patatin-like phospholipase family protein [Glaciecola sp. 2405UD65-10]|uniref:patatin-like phospholipase family protein n=1 Tax=Glaciecola sp. 2405UD65-10 TaxID=3397244 RepID=UPI003B58EF91